MTYRGNAKANLRALVLLTRAGLWLDEAVDRVDELDLHSGDLESLSGALNIIDRAYERLHDIRTCLRDHDATKPPVIPSSTGDHFLAELRRAA